MTLEGASKRGSGKRRVHESMNVKERRRSVTTFISGEQSALRHSKD